MQGAGFQQVCGDPLGRAEVDVEHRVPRVGPHVRESLVAGDARVVDDDVQAAMVFLGMGRDPLRGVDRGHVQQQLAAADSGHHLPQVVRVLRYVDTHHGGTVPGQRLGDRRADTPGGAGDHRDLARKRCRGVVADDRSRADANHLTIDVRRLRRQEEPQGRVELVVRVGGDVDQVDRGAALHLFAERPGETFEGALGDVLLGARGELGCPADHDHASRSTELPDDGGEESLERREVRCGGCSGRVEHQCLRTELARRDAFGRSTEGGSDVAEQGLDRLARLGFADRAEDDLAVDHPRTRGPALQRGRIGQAQVLHQGPAQRRPGERLVPIRHLVLPSRMATTP